SEDGKDLLETWARKAPNQPYHIGLKRHLKKDGTIMDVELITHDLIYKGKRARLALINDVTETRLAQETLHLLFDVTAAASESVDLHSMTGRCLELICKLKKWQVGQVWFVNDNQTELFCSHSYYSEIDLPDFRESSMKLNLRRGEGLPGSVWQHGAPVSSGD